MKVKFIVSVLLIAIAPAFAQAQNPSGADLKAKAQMVVKMISGDKAKARTYCEIARLGAQMDEADQQKDTKKADDLSQKIEGLAKQIGPEYVALMDGLEDADPDSEEEIVSMLQTLDKQCSR